MNTHLEFDAELLRRYDRPGPALHLVSLRAAVLAGASPTRTSAARRRAATRSRFRATCRCTCTCRICFSPCFYCGCNRIITRDLRRGAPYAERLVREAEMVAPLFDRDRDVVQVHFGGGTPNFLDAPALARPARQPREVLPLLDGRDRDFSIELDPRCVRDGDIAAYARMGFNRASLGVQDFDRAVQLAINREQSVEETLRAIDACRAPGSAP